MNVTVTQPTEPSYLTVFPNDTSGVNPLASNINFLAGDTVANLVLVPIGQMGAVCFYNAYGSVHVVVDVVGYYDGDRSTEAGRFVGVQPARSLDTRDFSNPLDPDSYGRLTMAGYDNVPLTGAGAVVVNVTAVGPTSPSFLTVFPDDLCEIPLASNVNFV